MTSAYGALDPDLPPAEPPRSSPLDRNLAMFGYLCLFFTVLFAGVPAFVMVILAYARQGDVDAVARSHLRFQIRTFWWCFVLTVLGVIGGIMSLVLGGAAALQASGLWLTVTTTMPVTGHDLGTGILWLVGGSALLLLLATLWTLIASVWGGFKLAVGAPIGRL